MGKAIGLFTGTTLVAATLWLATSGRSARDVRADVESGNRPVENRDTAQRELSARDLLVRGKQEFRRGSYQQALRTFSAAGLAPGKLTTGEQRELQDYLGRARTASQNAAVASAGDGGRYKAVARQHLNDARRAAARGDERVARALASRAAAFPVTWDTREQSPEEFLESLDNGTGQVATRRPVPRSVGEEQESLFGSVVPQAPQSAPRARPVDPAFEPQPAAPAPQPRAVAGDLPGGQPQEPVAPYAGGMTASAAGAAKRQQAETLLEQSRAALEAGRYEEARQKANAAAGMHVAWGLFDERPEHLLGAINRRAGETRFDRGAMLADGTSTGSESAEPGTTAEPAAGNSATPAGSTGGQKQQAVALLAQARQALQAGQYEEAHQLATQASQMEVAYGLFEDTPRIVLDDLARRAASTANIASRENTRPAGAASGTADPRTEQARALLQEARELLRAGNAEAASQKVAQAQSLDVPYGVFDDRPDLVAREIARFQNPGQPAANIAAADQVRPNGPQQDPSVRPASNVRDEVVSSTADGSESSLEARREQAGVLISKARLALKEGRVEEARDLADQAAALKVPFGVFDDRPDLVLADIRRKHGAPRMAALPMEVADSTDTAAPRNPLPRASQSGNDFPVQPSPAVADTGVRPQPQEDPFAVPPTAIPQPNSAEGTGRPESNSPIVTADAIADAPSPAPRAVTPQPVRPAASPIREAIEEPLQVVRPDGLSADELYRQGLELLARGDRAGAYSSFRRAHESGQRLNPYREQQLQDLLRELSPRRNQQIQLTSGQVPGGTVGETPRNANPDRIGAAEQQESIRFDRLRTETMNAVFRAERLKEQNPQGALEIIDRTIATVEASDLGEHMVSPMIRRLQKSRTSIASLQSQRAPIEELKARNSEVRDEIERERQLALRIDQEIADLVEEYNRLFKQKRYADCEVIARQIKELDAENPVGETLFWKARFGRRVSRNEELRLTKEEAVWGALDEVEWAAIPHHGDPMQFPKNWEEITSRRRGRYGPDNRSRTEEEKRIEKSLSRQISLHFQEIPLRDVMRHIATVADVNVVLDNLGLEEEGVSTDSPVSIDVNGIRLKSALNLLLEPLHLAYTIEDEVLKVTSRMRQQGRLVVATYPVADLVVPIPNFTPSGSTGMSSGGLGMQQGAMTGGNMSVPSSGGFQQAAGAQFQVADQMAGGANPWSGNPGLDAQLGGGGSAVDFDTITDLIVATVEPDSWDEVGGPGSVRSFETTLSLVIRQTQKVHEEIADLLEQLRRLQDLQVTIEVRFITVTDRFFERIGIDFDFDVNDNVEGDTTPGVPFGSLGGLGLTGVTGDDDDDDDDTGQTFFDPPTGLNLPELDDWPKGGTIVGLTAPDTFTTDLDVGFRQGSFDIGVPDFGGFNPDAGIQFGMAILSDIEAFFFVQAAQGDERANLMFAPKVTLFNGQQATVQSTVQRPFVTSLIPTVGFFSVGFTPQITTLSEGVTMQVQAVISADRRFVRLTVIPSFTNITDVFTFTFQSDGSGQAGQQGLGQGAGGVNQQGNGPISQPGSGQFSVVDSINPMMGFGGIGGGVMMRNALLPSLAEQVNTNGNTNQNNQNGGQNGLGVGNITVQQPVFEVVNVTTTVSVPDGGTVLLGGIKRLREGRNMAGVPILNKLPYVSRLFKNTGVGRETESLMMMVTPRIIIQEEEEELLGIPL